MKQMNSYKSTFQPGLSGRAKTSEICILHFGPGLNQRTDVVITLSDAEAQKLLQFLASAYAGKTLMELANEGKL